MRSFVPHGKSLKYYALVSWAIPGFIAIVSCLIVFFASAFVQYSSEIKTIEKDLSSKTYVVARALVGEVLIGSRGAIDPVARNLEKDFGLVSVAIFRGKPVCIDQAEDGACTDTTKNKMTRYHRLPSMDEEAYAVASVSMPAFWTISRIQTLLWSTIPLALMFAIGLWLQRYILHRYILKPVQTLVETSTGALEPDPRWPEEMKDISNRLYRSFELRDEEMFSQIARGVIHDLRTLIHSPLTAVGLVREATPEKRSRRLEDLYEVSEEQLLKMKEIIDNTLDGSREVTVNKASSNIQNSINGSIKTLGTIIKQNGVHVTTSVQDIALPHDAVQLERAITNIAKNAVEACQSSENKIVHISTAQVNNGLSIVVEDSGPGLKITEKKLFRPLKSTKVHGSGLGLIITRKIVEAHGGTLSVSTSSNLGGAKFSINLPMQSEAGV